MSKVAFHDLSHTTPWQGRRGDPIPTLSSCAAELVPMLIQLLRSFDPSLTPLMLFDGTGEAFRHSQLATPPCQEQVPRWLCGNE